MAYPDNEPENLAASQLRAFVERLERLYEESRTIMDDVKDVLGEAHGMGFDKKALKRLVALRRKDPQQRMEEEVILQTYMAALGME